jgi:hypothetical protein
MKKIKLFIALLIICSSAFSQYNYLGSYTSDGTPLYFAPADAVSTQTLSLIRNALPEGYPVPAYNPQYISSGYDTDIVLLDSADVWVTFVDEGAGYKNVLGFYTYNISNPPTTAPAANAVTIIFPNVSKAGSGGSLVAGNKVKIGTFPANTGIGFILIADGWRNGAVSNGNWKVYSNPDFNPETNPSLRYHNVLIADSTNKRIILGFEDIRRDYGSCDNDFNDALFYISANPYTAIKSSNFANIENSYQVSSGNNGGLESNGRLAEKIAKRFFDRQKNNTDKLSSKAFQQKRNTVLLRPNGVNGITGPLNSYFPPTGMYGNEESFVSTPSDLIGITNAAEVFSADYYKSNERVAAALVTHTAERVYDHTKIICDRLNGASLEDVRTIELNGHKLINTTFKRNNSEIEYAVTFSVKATDTAYSLYSLWSPEQYPAGEYLNFQVWGSSMGQVCNIVNAILQTLESEKAVVTNAALTAVPDVFIKYGEYKNGKLQLTVCNRKGVGSIRLNGSGRVTETAFLSNISQSISLSGAAVQHLEINTGYLFDIGLSVAHSGNTQTDALYLADGAWGTDYDSNLANDIDFTVASQLLPAKENALAIERAPAVKGKVKGTLNLFRNTRAGNVPLDISQYKNISFEIQSDRAAEIVLAAADLQNWDARARHNIPASEKPVTVTIPLSKFTGLNGQQVTLSTIKTIVFSVSGNYQQFSSFGLKVSKVNFNNDDIQDNKGPVATAFPNPVIKFTALQFNTSIKSGMLQVTDAGGKSMITKEAELLEGRYILDAGMLAKGMYFFTITTKDGKKITGKFSKQ